MADEKNEPKQKTPKGHEIPVPKREDVLRDLAKVSVPDPVKGSKKARRNPGG